MKKGILILAVAIGALIIVAGAGAFWRTHDVGVCGLRISRSVTPVASHFIETVYAATDAKMGGHPIDSGYGPDVLMQTYPGFQSSDFHCVEAEQGRYLVKDGQIDFHSTAGNRVSTAERAITQDGMARILKSAAGRLQMPFATNAEVDAILARLASVSNTGSSPIEDTNSILDTEWVWSYTDADSQVSPGRLTAPAGGKFVITFGSDKRFHGTTDCNSLFGNFILDGEVLSIGPVASTKMACASGSLASTYSAELGRVASYVIVGDELHLNLVRDTGTMVFIKKF